MYQTRSFLPSLVKKEQSRYHKAYHSGLKENLNKTLTRGMNFKDATEQRDIGHEKSK